MIVRMCASWSCRLHADVRLVRLNQPCFRSIKDIYGDDIYGGASEAFGDVPSPQRPDDEAAPQVIGAYRTCKLSEWCEADVKADDDNVAAQRLQADAEGSAAAAEAGTAPEPASASAREAQLQVGQFMQRNSGRKGHVSLSAVKVLQQALRACSDSTLTGDSTLFLCSFQAQLRRANAELDAWRKALAGDVPGSVAVASPAAAAAALQKARDDAAAAQAQANTATQRAGGLEYGLAEKNLENVQLRRSLHTARQAADPSIVQASS